MKYSYLLLTYSLFLSFVSFGQSDSMSVNGSVLENGSGKSIPYAHIYNEHKAIGTVADEQGQYHFDFSKLDKEQDSITISSIGYHKKVISINELLISEGIIMLEQNSNLLNEFIVQAANYKKKEIGNLKRPEFGSYSMFPGGEYACWIPNDKKYIGNIVSVSVFVRDIGTPNTPFRIHIYSRNKVSLAPDTELLDRSIVVNAQKGNQWVKIKLDSIYIVIPKDGFFISIEWLYDSKKDVVTERFGNHTLTHYGQVIGAISEPIKKGNRTWNRSYLGKWNFHDAEARSTNFKVVNVINLAVKAEIEYKKGGFAKEENTSIKYKALKKGQLKKISKLPPVDLSKYPNFSPKTLFESIYKSIAEDSIIYTISHLCTFTKEAKKEILEEFGNRKRDESWLTMKEKENALKDFDYFIKELKNAELKNIDTNKYEITFPNGESTYLEKRDNRWYLMPYFKKLIRDEY